jgi:hypothetical protein
LSRRNITGGLVVGRAALVLFALASMSHAGAADAGTQRFPVTTDPAGAAVSSIVGDLGVTPLQIDERDIYPNEFPPEMLERYGKLFIIQAGCEAVTHQVTLAEVGSGVAVALDCQAPHPPLPIEVLGGSTEAAPAASAGAAPEPMAERRLRQLRVLDELLRDGLLSLEEERAIRLRILAH